MGDDIRRLAAVHEARALVALMQQPGAGRRRLARAKMQTADLIVALAAFDPSAAAFVH
jgi:hypothetical protein